MLGIIKGLVVNDFCDLFHIRRKPRVLQMPVTSRCNSRCKTCNVWHEKINQDINYEVLKQRLKDDYFSKVDTVGLNGGEITLLHNYMDVINALLVLPNLKTVHIISNGLLPDRLFAMLKEVRLLLNSRNVRLGLTLSIDGYGSVHEKVRGVPNCFNRTLRILDEFKNAPSLYFDYFVIGCTISKYNIEYIRETETFLSLYPFQVYYHLAVPNKRIGTFENADYSVLTDELSTLLATEYYYTKWTSTSIRKQFITKFNYFANYYYLLHGGNGRLASCIYRYRDITITENLDVALCATASDVIGNLNKNEISQIMSKNNLRDIEKCTFKNCKSCIHYTDFPTIRGLLIFLYHFYLNRKKWGRMYK